MASRIERSSAIFASTRATCSRASRFTSALARSRSDHSESSRPDLSDAESEIAGAMDELEAGARRGR